MSLRTKFEDIPSDELQHRLDREGMLDHATMCPPPPRHDPFFTPIFTSWLTSSAIGFSIGTAKILAAVGSALAAGGDYREAPL